MKGRQYLRCKSTVNGSVTVFLTMIFLLLFSLLGVTFENIRVMASESYIRMAAHSAAMTIFGNYNRELYEDYGLFAYGGFNGIGAAELEQELQLCLEDNLMHSTQNETDKYTDLYRFQKVAYTVDQTKLLTDSEIFNEQVKAFLKGAAVKNLTQDVLDKISGQQDGTEIEDKLAMTKDFEDGKYDDVEESDEDNQKEVNEKKSRANQKESLEKDAAKGNPLETFSDIAKTGVLNLVCDADGLEEGEILMRDSPDDEKSKDDNLQDKEESDYKTSSEALDKQEVSILKNDKTKAADYLNQILENSDGSVNTSLIKKGVNKIMLISYGNQQLSNYVTPKERTTKYGLEYLVAGKEKEKDNLSAIVNRLLALRMLLNFTYVATDAGLQSKSLATATVIAGFTGLTPVIKAVQYTILLILAFQEACVDVTALLEGRSVPLLKNISNFKMNYEEICMGTKSLFQSKAKQYQQAEKKGMATDISYEQYLWLFLFINGEDTIRNRLFDLIQYDLREKYNQSFCIDSCICQGTYLVSYQIPGIFQNLPLLNTESYWNPGEKKLEVRYGYKSE